MRALLIASLYLLAIWAVIVMAGVSMVGFVVLGVIDGQLAVGLDEAGRVNDSA